MRYLCNVAQGRRLHAYVRVREDVLARPWRMEGLSGMNSWLVVILGTAVVLAAMGAAELVANLVV